MPPDAHDFRLVEVSVGFGVAAGGTWWKEGSLGPGEPFEFQPAGSPAAAFELEFGRRAARLFLGLDSAPTFLYTIGYDLGGLHLTALSAGPLVGTTTFRAGPYAGVGMAVLEIGAHAIWSPWEGPHARRGLELRAAWLPAHAFEGMLLFRWGWGVQ